MSVFDIVLLVLLLGFGAIGALRGMIREVLSFSVWIGGAVIGWLFAPMAEPHLKVLSNDPALRSVLAFILLFIATWVGGIVLGFVLQRLIAGKRALNWPNRIAGGAIGAARGGIFVVIAFLFAGLTSLPQRSWWQDSTIAPHFEVLARWAADYLPRDVARHIHYG